MTNFLTLVICAGLILYEASETFRELVKQVIHYGIKKGEL